MDLRASIATLLVAASCKPVPQVTPAPAEAPAELVALTGASVMIGSGDIARCGTDGDERTARIVDSILKRDSIAGVSDYVFTTGDNAYPDGSARDFERCFTPSWGDPKKSIMKQIHPSPGNHEHRTNSAAPYYLYFGERAAGSSKKGYYAYDIGVWRAIALNTEIIVNPIFSSKDITDQEEWLKTELKTSAKECTIVYFHHPRYSSGWHGSDAKIASLWKILYDNGVDVVIGGHDHHYERFAPMNDAGVRDSAKGVVSFVIGTGGGELRGLRTSLALNSEYRLQGYYGVLKFTLGGKEYSYAFIDTEGRIWDPGAGKCH